MRDERIGGSLMVCGTASNVGKSLLVTGLCRLLSRRGMSVAPFKGQNMSLNSVVTASGAEIGRAQGAQADAAGTEPEAAMNPVLLKPTTDRRSQVVVMGRPWRVLDAAAYQAAKPQLKGLVLEALAGLRSRFDVVLLEGAGSPAEINLLEGDLVNLGLADAADIPAVVVGDIDRGGVFAHLFGTVALLPDALRARVQGFVINKFRGDPALLGRAPAELAARTGVPTLGVVPWLDGVAIDAEDSLALASDSAFRPAARALDGADIDVAVVRFPRVSNFTDLDALGTEPGVALRWVEQAGQLGAPDLVVLPGTKSTVADLEWLRDRGLADALISLVTSAEAPVVIGICGGLQMLGRRIEDPAGVERATESTDGLGLLDAVTRFVEEKRTARRRGKVCGSDVAVTGYQIHHGLVELGDGATGWFELETPAGPFELEGVIDADRAVYGTTLHGVLENDAFRADLLAQVADRRSKAFSPGSVPFAEVRRRRADVVADALEAHLDLETLWRIVAGGRPA